MIDLIGKILCSSIKNLFKNQPDITKDTYKTVMTEWNLGHHLANEIYKYIFWLNHDVDVSKRNIGNRRPDIIFHKRGINSLNFLVIELKHRGTSSSDDIRKIKEDWMGHRLHYRFGASININNERMYKVTVFHSDEEKIFNQSSDYIPIRRISVSKHNFINDIVDQILSLTKDNDYPENSAKQTRVKEYEQQIDQMVYKLYGLTDEEIKIVENFNNRE